MEQIKKSQKLYNIQWYKKGTGSAQDYLISILKDDEILLHRHTEKEGRQWGITTPENLFKITQKNRGLYEVIITDRKRKLYFDIDVSRSIHKDILPNVLLKQCRTKLIEEFPGAILQVSGSVTTLKISYHIIISNWYADTLEDILCLKEFTTSNSNLFFDNKVYTSNRNMKLINQSKPDGRVQSFIEGDTSNSKHFITCFFEPNSININTSNVYKTTVAKPTNQFNLLEIPQLQMITPLNFDYHNSTFLEKLNIIPLYNRGNSLCLSHGNIRKILIWAKQVGISFEEFWTWNKQKDNDKDRLDKWYDIWTDCDFNIGTSAIEAILKRFYPKITQNMATIKFTHNFELPVDKIIEGSYLHPDCINPNTKYSLLISPMGSNKTGTIINSLKGQRVLWITPRITLSENTLQRLKDEDLEFNNYRDFSTKDKKEGKLENGSNVICSIQSLHYLKKQYSVIVIDEIETVLNTFSSSASTHGKNCIINWMYFKDFLLKAKNVFLMDAFTTKLTTDLVKALEPKASIEFINTSNPPEPRYFEQQETFNDWVFNIIESIKQGKKLFIFTPFKDGLKGVETLSQLLIKTFKWTDNQQIISYHSGKTKEKKKLSDCENIWGNPEVKCIVTNSCITVGVNFNRKNVFDEIHCFFSPVISARDFIQSLYRVRHPKSKTMSIYMESTAFFKEYIQNVVDKPNCDIFKQMSKNLDIEEDANRNKLDTLYLICQKANIKFILIRPEQTTEENRKEIQKLLNQNSLTFNFDSIKDISEDEMIQIGEILNSNLDTIDLRLQFDKYHFKKLFKKEQMKEAAYFWNTGKKNFILRYIDAKYCPTNIIYRLFKDNKIRMDYTIKSNPELKSITLNEIQMYFKFHNKPKDNRIDLIMKMINAYFERDVLALVKDKTGDYKYSKITINEKRYLKYHTSESFITDVKRLDKALNSEEVNKYPEEIKVDNEKKTSRIIQMNTGYRKFNIQVDI